MLHNVLYCMICMYVYNCIYTYIINHIYTPTKHLLMYCLLGRKGLQ